MKKSILLLIAAVSTMGSFAKVGDTFTSGNINYKVVCENESSNEVVVTSPLSTEISTATIPSSTANGGTTYKVTGINHKAFENCANLKTVSMPSTITWIGAYSFDNCTSLAQISIPESVKSIGRQAFSGCTSLTKVTLNGNIEWMGDDVFLGCSALQSVTIPQNISNIGGGMFEQCDNLSSVTMGESITNVGDYAFAKCSMKDITIPVGVKQIGDGAFAYNDILATVSIPNSVERFGSAAFSGCQQLTHVTLPSWLTSLGYGEEGGLIDGCDEMTEITIPAYVENVGDIALHPTSLVSVFVMGDRIPVGLATLPTTNANGELITIYVKKSVFDEKYSSGEWLGHTVNYRIPITMTNAKGNGVKYKTLCRDFDIDLSYTNEDLSEGTSNLRAYLAPAADEGLGIVFMEEINYIPSRIKANEEGFQGEDEYVGIVLRGTPGATYYYQMGENDYTQGVGQWLLEDATAAVNRSPWNNNLMRGANDVKLVNVTETDPQSGQTFKNYGLSNNAFHIYSKAGWLGYGKAYLSVPQNMSAANITMTFTDADGSTDSIELQNFIDNCDEGNTYDLSGKRVGGEHKGIIIQYGKKRVK